VLRPLDSETPQLHNCRVSQSVLNKLIATLVFESGSAFRIVTSTYFKRLIKPLAPELEVPSPKRVGDELLEEAYDELMDELIKELSEQPYIGLVLDGLRGLKHEKLINFVAVGPNFAPVHLKTIAVTIISQTGKFLADLILSVVDWLEKFIGVGKVATITSDNAPNMEKSWSIIESTRGILCNGCAAHTLNLLLQDIAKLDAVNRVTSGAETITTYFMRRSQLLARLKAEKAEMNRSDSSNVYGRTLTIPVVTRWYSSYQCLVNVIRNREAITRVFDDEDFMEPLKGTKKRQLQLPPLSRAPTSTQKSKRTKKKSQKAREAQEAQVAKENATKSPKAIAFARVEKVVRDDDFLQKGEQVIQLLKPIIKKLGLMEPDRCCISLIYLGFRDLLWNPTYCEPRFLETTANQIRFLIKSRWDNTHRDAMGIAYYLDPSQDPRDFVGSDRHKTKSRFVKWRSGWGTQKTRLSRPSTRLECFGI
jgi:23S rRNA U2552 (ribose-2'-O)-methylase RlmE/FtsJ